MTSPRDATGPLPAEPAVSVETATSLVMRGAKASGADHIARALATAGDSAYLFQLKAGRNLHIATLTSALNTGRPSRFGNIQVSSGEDISLGTGTLGLAQVYNATTAIGFGGGGTTGNLTGQVSYRGTEVNIKVKYHTENLVGSLPALYETEDESNESADVDAQVNCIVTHTSNPSVCGFADYSEMSISGLQLGQPCGTKMVARTRAVATIDFAVIGQIIDVINAALKWKIPGPSASTSSPYVEANKNATNATCVPPVVTASLGGDATGSGGSYTATITNGNTTASVLFYGTESNSPLPSDVEYSLKVNGSNVALEPGTSVATVNLTAGTHNFEFKSTDVLLGQVGTAYATVTVTAETCDESGGGETLRGGQFSELRVGDQSSLCGNETGSPGGGSGGDPPPGGVPPNCQWVRYYVIYTDGSWDWMGPWEHECEGDPMLRAQVPTTPGTTLRIRLSGTEPLKSGRTIEVHRYPGLDVDAVVNVDLTRATSADLEAALLLAEAIGDVKGSGHIGGIQGPPSQKARANSGPSSRSDGFFKALSQAGRSIDVSITRRQATQP